MEDDLQQNGGAVSIDMNTAVQTYMQVMDVRFTVNITFEKENFPQKIPTQLFYSLLYDPRQWNRHKTSNATGKILGQSSNMCQAWRWFEYTHLQSHSFYLS